MMLQITSLSVIHCLQGLLVELIWKTQEETLMSFQRVFARSCGHLIRRQSCILVMDPLQQLVTKKQQIHLSGMALVNLAFHGYTQAGLRANEWFEQTLGALERGFCFGEEAARKRVRPHFRLRVKAQTKENRMFTRKVLCCEHAKRAPLCAGVWARAVVRDMRAAGRSHDDALVFAEPDGRAWRMTVFWFSHIRPRLEQLQ